MAFKLEKRLLPKAILNAEFGEEGAFVHAAFPTATAVRWIEVGFGDREIPTIKLTPEEARAFAAELLHYAKVAEDNSQ